MKIFRKKEVSTAVAKVGDNLIVMRRRINRRNRRTDRIANTRASNRYPAVYSLVQSSAVYDLVGDEA